MQSKIIELLRITGSPFSGDCHKKEVLESEVLFKLAHANRIGLLYLQTLKDNGKLKKLEKEYNNLYNRYHETLVTTANLSVVLNDNNIPYTTIKTIRPFPATPNDVDVIFLGRTQDFKEANNILKKNGYREFLKAPGQILYFDERSGDLFNKVKKVGKQGGIYYIDFYRELMVKRFIYLDRKKLSKYIIEQKILEDGVTNVLMPPVDLALILFHACFPNRMYSLEIFYTTLFHLKSMGKDDIIIFNNFIKNSSIQLAVKSSLSITKEIYSNVFGEVPQIFSRLLNRKEIRRFPIRKIVCNAELPPFKVKFWLFFTIFIHRLSHFISFRSFIVQILCFINPKYLIRFLNQLLNKKEIDDRYKQV